MDKFTHLHLHTEYSLLDGAAKIKDLVTRAGELEQSSMALTDHGAMYGAINFYKECKKQGIKPILGFEAYIARGSRHEKNTANREYNHLTLLAKDIEGYSNLIKLCTIGHLEGKYYNKPRLDHEVLAQHSKGLIALSGCLSGELSESLLAGDESKARETLAFYRDTFGQGNYFVELQRHGIPDQLKIEPQILQLAKEFNLPLVATNDSHYTNHGDHEAHDVLLCIQTGKNVSDPVRMRFDSQDFYLKSADEMQSIFSDLPEALSNTLLIAQSCDLQLTMGESLLPEFAVPAGESPDSYLRKMVEEGFKQRYPNANAGHFERLEEEMSVITQMNYSSYFLIVWDFIRFARETGVPVGPGRGSAAGSLVAYCLGITNLDPIEYGLLFERFLNKDRISMPDIDVDFSQEGRERVINYVTERYGSDHVAQIITFSTLQAKAAIRDVGKVMQIDKAVLTAMSKAIPDSKTSLSDAIKMTGIKELYSDTTHPQYKEMLDVALTLEGVSRDESTHAAGVVIGPRPLSELVPLCLSKKTKGIQTQYDMKAIGDLGLLKMDFLGLQNLDIMKRCLELIKRHQGLDLNLDTIPLDDGKTYELICETNTQGTFQLESPGMRRLLAELKPSAFSDIVAAVALFRPGPMRLIPQFIACKHGRSQVQYPHPKLEKILKETYGIMVYQEDVMMAAREVAGFTLPEADSLRAAMGKKDKEKMAQMKIKFVAGCIKNDMTEQEAVDLFAKMETFADYGFNKSHSAVYGLLAYQTCYLKANYPLEYMCAYLSFVHEKNDAFPTAIADTRNNGIAILPPDVNRSEPDFSIEGDKIRFGLAALRNLGDGAADRIFEDREENGMFLSLHNLVQRMHVKEVKAPAIEALILSGACDRLHRLPDGQFADRGHLAASVSKLIDKVRVKAKKGASDQGDLFGGSDAKELDTLPVEAPLPWTAHEILSSERKATKVYLSGHPYSAVAAEIDTRTDRPLSEIKADLVGETIRVAGLIRHVTERTTAAKKQKMANVILEDAEGNEIGMVVFPRAYEEFGNLVKEDEIILVEGKVSVSSRQGREADNEETAEEEEAELIVQRIWNQENALKEYPRLRRELHVHLESREGIADDLRSTLQNHPGRDRVIIHLLANSHKVAMAVGKEFYVNSTSPGLLRDLKNVSGADDVRVETIKPNDGKTRPRDPFEI